MNNNYYYIKKSGYKITNTINPGQNEISERLTLLYSQKTFVSVSIKHPWFIENASNENFWRLKVFFNWLFGRYEHITFFIADSLHRFNLNFNSIGLNDDFEEAKKAGLKQKSIILDVLNELNICTDNYNFLHSSEIYMTSDFQNILEHVISYYDNDINLKNAIIKSAESYWYRKYKDGFCFLSQQQDITLSTNFIIEEIAYFAYLSKIQGFVSNVYPGDFLYVFKSIDFGQYPELSILKNQNFQTVKLKKRL